MMARFDIERVAYFSPANRQEHFLASSGYPKVSEQIVGQSKLWKAPSITIRNFSMKEPELNSASDR
jgi:hypothetical protein